MNKCIIDCLECEIYSVDMGFYGDNISMTVETNLLPQKLNHGERVDIRFEETGQCFTGVLSGWSWQNHRGTIEFYDVLAVDQDEELTTVLKI